MTRIAFMLVALMLGLGLVASAQTAPPPGPANTGPSFVDANGDGICDLYQQGAQQGRQAGRVAKGYGPGDGTGNKGIGPRDGSGYGPGTGTCTGSCTGPRQGQQQRRGRR